MTATRPLLSSEAAYCRRQLVFIIAYICCFTSSSSSSFYIEAFQSCSQQEAAITTRSSRSSSNLFATGNGSSSGGMGFGSNNSNNNGKKKGKKPKYTIEDKSYGGTTSSSSSLPSSASAEEFFTTYNEWLPLFREYSNSLSAHSILTTAVTTNDNSNDDNGSDTLWGISTIEGRTPWKLLPSKPEHPTPLSHIGTFLDEWQRSLLDIPIDTLTKEEDIGKGNNDLHFLEEGRRTIAVTRFHVVDGDEYAARSGNAAATEEEVVLDQWENEVFRTCWSEIGHLMSQDVDDTGSLVVLPNIPLPVSSSFNQEEEEENSSLEYIQQFVEKKLVQPISWMGRSEDWEIVAMNRGNLAVRLLYKLSDIPDLSEKYSPDED